MRDRLLLVCVLACTLVMAPIVMGDDEIVISQDGENDWSMVASDVTLKIEGNSGKLRLRHNVEPKNSVEVAFDRVVEYDRKPDNEKSSCNLNNQRFEWGTPESETVDGVATTRIAYNATLCKGKARIHCVVHLYQKDATVVWANKTYTVKKHHAKFTVKIRDWPWESAHNFLRVSFELKVNGGSWKPNKSEDYFTAKDYAFEVEAGKPKPDAGEEKRVKFDRYGIIDFATQAIVDGEPSNITVDTYKWGNHAGIALNFPHFETSLEYDPTFGLLPNPNNAFRVPIHTFSLIVTALIVFFMSM